MGHLPPFPVAVANIFVVFLGIAIHEYCHCKFADLAGDPTPRYYGRVTLNPFKHFDPAGSIFIFLTMYIGYGIGWGKPAPMDPRKMRDPRWDFFIAVIAGPISNILQAMIFAALFRIFISPSLAANLDENNFNQLLPWIIIYGVIINIALAIFNLIPFGPLDGQWLLGLLLPEKQRYQFWQFNRKVGFAGLIGAVLLLQFFNVDFLVAPINWGFHLLTGARFS